MGSECGISENLGRDKMERQCRFGENVLFSEQVAETCDGIVRIFDELMLGLVSNVLRSEINSIDHKGDETHTHYFLAMEGDSACDLSLSIFIRYALRQSFLISGYSVHSTGLQYRTQITFVKTAIEAKALPKLIPTTAGMDETSMGASAVPLTMGFGAIDEDQRIYKRTRKRKV